MQNSCHDEKPVPFEVDPKGLESLSKCQSERLDVLHIVGSRKTMWPMPSWFTQKCSRWSRKISEMGKKARFLVPSIVDEAILWESLIALRPRLMISRAFALEPDVWSWLAVQIPETKMLQMNHTPNSFTLGTSQRGAYSSYAAIQDALAHENLYYGVVSKRDHGYLEHLFGSPKILYLPNPAVKLGNVSRPRKAFNPCCCDVAVAGRTVVQKNLKNQVDAVACIAKTRKTRLHLILGKEQWPELRDDITRYAKELLQDIGSELRVFPFFPPQAFLEYLNSHIDVLLHCTADESFGYLPWEAMTLGIPVIGSPGSPVCSLEAEPTDVLDILEKTLMVLQDLEGYGSSAKEESKRIAGSNDESFEKAISDLLVK